MDMTIVRQIVDELFQGRNTVGKQDLLGAAQRVGLPTDRVQSLPDKQFTKDEVLRHLGGSQGGGIGGDISEIERKIA